MVLNPHPSVFKDGELSPLPCAEFASQYGSNVCQCAGELVSRFNVGAMFSKLCPWLQNCSFHLPFFGNCEEFVEKAVCGQTAVKKTRAFTLEVVEDADAGLKLETRSGPIQFEKDPNDASAGAIGGGRKEGCSCIFGNPCQDPEVCLDWHNREAVAKKNGWKGV